MCKSYFPSLPSVSCYLKEREGKSLLNWKGVCQRFFSHSLGKQGIFLARVGRATVIQMKLNYSGVGPIYCRGTSAVAREYSNGVFYFFIFLSSSSRRRMPNPKQFCATSQDITYAFQRVTYLIESKTLLQKQR